MEKGFIRLSRSFFSNNLWQATRAFSGCEAWLDLIQSARFEASQAVTSSIGGCEVTCGRGQYPASVRFLAKKWGRTEKWVRFLLARLKREGMITIDNSQGISVITLVNYDRFNPIQDNTEENALGTPSGTVKGTPNKLYDSILQINGAQSRAQVGAHPLKNIDNLGHSEGTNKKKDKEYYSSSTTNERMCAYEEKSEFNFSSELRNEVFFWERAAMQLNRTVEQLKKMQGKFDFDCETEQKGHFDYNAYKRHFRNWIRIQIEKQDHAAKNITGNFTSKEAANRAVIDDYYSRLSEFEKGVHEPKPDLFLCAEEL